MDKSTINGPCSTAIHSGHVARLPHGLGMLLVVARAPYTEKGVAMGRLRIELSIASLNIMNHNPPTVSILWESSLCFVGVNRF